MPLHLVSGPANSGKAGRVLGAYRERLEQEPILVVPAFRDVDWVQRELARGGAVLGTRVVRFAWLFRLIAERCDLPRARSASRLRRELLVEQVVSRTTLSALAASAERPGFPRAAARLVAELERSMVSPARFTQALREWAGDGPRRAYANDVAAIYRGYRKALEEAGLMDPELIAWRALDALRAEPQRWDGSAVFVYGFDDFTPLELDALETLSERCGADVTVSLPYERGRVAFRAVAKVFERLSALAGESTELEAVTDHYAPGSREPLHHVERALFTDPSRRPDPGDAVRLLSAGGERAETEQVAAEVLKLLRDGTEPGRVAVVLRRPGDRATLVEQVFGAYGIPYSLERRVAFAHTPLGRGLLALLRCALLDGSADDLLAYLRTAGRLTQPQLADRLERDARQRGLQSATEARTLWEGSNWTLDEIDHLRRARAGSALITELDGRLERLFAAPYKRRAHVLGDEELDDARAWSAAHSALADLREAAAAGFELDARAVHDRLAAAEVRLGEQPRHDRVRIAAPEAVRAQRYEAVFVCGLQEGVFPRGSRPEPFLPDDDRRAIATASGLVLPVRDDELDRERYLFYVSVSRAERLLALSACSSDEEGHPLVESFFLDDVRDLFTPELGRRAARRSLSEVVWPPADAPTEREWERATAALGPRRRRVAPDGLSAPAALEELAGRERFSASSLETFADCPVKWLVDNLLAPAVLEPDPEYMVRGSYAHEVLERTFRGLQERTGAKRITLDNLGEAEAIALEALRELQSEFALSPKETRVRAAVRRLEFDVLRLLRDEARAEGAFETEHVELGFGLEGDALGELELEEGMRIRGKIDRVDVHAGHAVVRDYKSGKTVFKAADWSERRRLQVPLYMLAVRQLLGLEPVAGVYVPLAGGDRRARGMFREDCAEELGRGYVGTDARTPEQFEEELQHARETVRDVAGRMRAGAIRPCPETCAWRGGCSYPSICGEEA
jgi:ATP-dependent helicase/DNAse subunit B